MELYLGDAFLTFDGAVVESFGASSTSNGRVHVGILSRVEVGETRRGTYLQFHTIWGGSPLLISFRAEQRPQAVWFAGAVEEVLADRRS